MKPSLFYSLLALVFVFTALFAHLHDASSTAVIIGTVNGCVLMAAASILREMGR